MKASELTGKKVTSVRLHPYIKELMEKDGITAQKIIDEYIDKKYELDLKESKDE